jgi:uncharacterized OsmC-like protein
VLEARGIDASGGRLTAEVKGEVGKEDGVLVIRRIHCRYLLQADGADEAAIQRAFELHPMRCPVYRTLYQCIEITTELALV